MRYVVQRRNALGRLEWLGEHNVLQHALVQCRQINRERPRYYKLYPAYIFDTENDYVHRQGDFRGYWCYFVGGSSYSIGEAEYFKSIPAIKNALWRRLNDQQMYPCLSDDARFECHVGFDDGFVDFIVKVGPRGGIVKENC